jgi:hypothetical protein
MEGREYFLLLLNRIAFRFRLHFPEQQVLNQNIIHKVIAGGD